MGGLILLFIIVLWVFLVSKLTSFLSQSIPASKYSSVLKVLLFVLLLVLPFLDEIIGRWQFQRLCSSEAVVFVSDDAKLVTAARDDTVFVKRNEFLIPIQEQAITNTDIRTGKVFYSVKAFHTPGGWVMRAGLNMGSSSSCWPEKWTSKDVGVDIDALLKKGKEL